MERRLIKIDTYLDIYEENCNKKLLKNAMKCAQVMALGLWPNGGVVPSNMVVFVRTH